MNKVRAYQMTFVGGSLLPGLPGATIAEARTSLGAIVAPGRSDPRQDCVNNADTKSG